MTIVVTIDGPAGSGKSTVARLLAERLGFQLLDTGALYRAVALACLREGVSAAEEQAVTQLLRQVRIEFRSGRVLLNGDDVTDRLRTLEIGDVASIIAAYRPVRSLLNEIQRTAVQGERTVSEGRDQGTVVFPDASCKFFLTATPMTRALRRQRELLERGEALSLEAILEQQEIRDQRDQNRAFAPLRPADDAVLIDTSEVAPESVVDQLELQIRDRLSPQHESES